MEHITIIVGHLAWPVTIFALGLIVVRELKRGLLSKVLPDGGSIEAGGFKLQTYAAKQHVRNAKIHLPDEIEIDPKKGLTPYDQVIDAWRELARAVTETAVKHGGIDDQRKINSNLDTLREKGAYDIEVLDGVGELFQARNSARKLGADSMAETDATAFVSTAKALTKVFGGGKLN